ncbi:MAG TPA: hypothetical protein VJN01_02185 [Xanthomonadales bacterium]|nr:hypothetical protein [Xanthomonadales bacterium]
MNRASAVGLVVMVLLALHLSGCGSTKVYTADKTVVYQQSVYNLANVKVITRKSTAVMADQSVIDLANMDEEGFLPLLAISPSIAVRQVFLLDDIELVYQHASVASWKEFKKLDKRFQSASKDLNKFLANSKKTQLKLK